jgi:hypothetical protein
MSSGLVRQCVRCWLSHLIYDSYYYMDTKRFSRWTRWADRDNFDNLHFPGVYAIAVSKEDLSGRKFSWIEAIAYFGMTNAAKGLKSRLKQFDNTIIGKRGHGGADRFRHDYPRYEDLVKVLFVSVVPFKCKVTSNAPADLLIMGDVAKAEYECFAKYAKAFHHLPKYNDKKKSPKHSKAS